MSNTIILNAVEYIPVGEANLAPSTYQIVVLQRGWVVVGKVAEPEERPDEYVITDAQVIRRWGTSKGLGELRYGPLADTKLDSAGTVRAHKLGVVLRIDVNADAWRGAANPADDTANLPF